MPKSVTTTKSTPSRGIAPPVTPSASPLLTEHLASSARVLKRVLARKANSRKFLIEAGILNKSGKGLAKPYR
jgi:hypothetical protein